MFWYNTTTGFVLWVKCTLCNMHHFSIACKYSKVLCKSRIPNTIYILWNYFGFVVCAGGHADACSLLTNPNNGVITCSLGDDGVPSYKDNCSFTCNVGYLLSGSKTRSCQSDVSWSGTEIFCRRGE